MAKLGASPALMNEQVNVSEWRMDGRMTDRVTDGETDGLTDWLYIRKETANVIFKAQNNNKAAQLVVTDYEIPAKNS